MKRLAEALIFVAALAGLVGAASDVMAANRFAVANTAWNLTSTWSASSGGAAGASVPVAGDDVFIGNTATVRTVTIPAGYAAAATSVTIGNATAVAGGSSLTLSAANASLATSGNFIINRPSNATTNLLSIGAGTVTVGGSVTLAGTNTTTTRINRISLTTGTLNIAGNLVFITGSAAGNSIVITGAATINLAGAFTATVGTLTPGTTSIFNYNGSVAQTVRRVSNIFYNHLHLNNSNAAGATLSAAVAATNVTGNIRVQSGILNNGGFAIVGGAGDTFEIANGARFNLTGTSAMPSAFSTYTLGSTSTTSFQGGNQTIAAVSVTTAVPITYGHVIAQGGSTKTAGAATPPAALNIAGNLSIENATTFTANTSDPIINVTGNMAINGTGIYTASNNAARPLTVSGNFSVAGTYTGNVAPLNLAGDFTRTGTFTSSTGVVTFNGASMVAPQTLTGATTFTSMTVNNTGLGLSLANNMTVTTAAAGSLVLTNGVVTTGSNVLIVPRPCNNAATVTRTNGYVVGNLQKAIPVGATTCVYQVGAGGNYSPASLAFTGVGGAGGGLIGRVGLPVGDHPNIGTSGLNSTKSVNRWWGFTTTGVTGTALPAFTNYGATLTFVAGDVDGGANTANFEIERWNGATWSITTVGTRTGTSTQATGITALGELAIAEKAPIITPPDSFNAVEVGAAVTGRIFTKLRSANFTLDIVAIQGGAQQNTFSEAVTIDVVTGGSAGANCGGGAVTTVAGPTDVTLASGRVTTGTINVATAYPDVRVRIRYPVGGPYTITTCSSDNFSIRPAAFTSVASTTLTNNGTTGTPRAKAGATFDIAATAGAGYNGAPSILGSSVAAHAGAVQTGALTGSFVAANPATGTASGPSFIYSEVGSFTIGALGVYDDTFTDVSSDKTNGDCTADFSNTLVGGKYGCSFGNTAASSVIGRFTPDHFIVTPGTLTNRRVAACAPASTFTYEGEELRVTFMLTARNGLASPTTTQNYTTASGFAKLDGTAAANFGLGAVDLADGIPPTAGTALTARLTTTASSGTWSAGTINATVDLFVTRAASPDGPFESFRIGTLSADTDGVTLRAADFDLDTDVPVNGNDRVRVGSSSIRFGRLRLNNANGSQLVPLSMLMETQYWNGSSFITHADDSCTSIGTANVGLGNYTGNLNSPETVPSIAVGAFSKGRNTLTMSAPGATNNGSVDIVLNLGTSTTIDSCLTWGTTPTPAGANLTHLRGRWCGATHTKDPNARATFGARRGSEEVIHSRENF